MTGQENDAKGTADVGLVLQATGCALVLLLDMAFLVGGVLVVTGAVA